MLDHCSISHKGGAILWSRSFTPSASPVNSLVREAIIQDRAAPEDVFEKDGYAIKFKFVNDLELIFVVAYQRILQLTYVDDLLNVMRSVFVDMFAPFLKTFLAAMHAGTGAVTRFDFKAQFAEWDATFDKILRTLQDKATQERKARLNKPTPRVALPVTPPSDTGTPTQYHTCIQFDLLYQPQPYPQRHPQTQQKSHETSDTSHTPRKKPTKTARRWADSALRPEDLASLDYSSAPSDVDNSRSIDISQLVDESSRGAVGADGLYEVKDLDLAATKDEETEDLISRALTKSQEKEETAKSTAWSWLSRLTGGGKVLTSEDLAPVLNGMREHLMKKNVAKEIADKVCESVGEGLVGKRVSGFASIKSETREALSSAITRILTPKTSTDLLLSIRSQKATQPTPQPYVITFVGVNGVGKSTSLGKVAFWLLQNNLRVLVAACDTFRSGAVEQLRVHVRNLGMLNDGGEKIELYEKGYGKDAAGIAKEAVAYAGQKGYDVVLVDTAGRMQDNEPLMKALAKLVSVNQPDKIIFVGEALVGNEAVDQLSKFDRALKDFSNGRGIDGMLVTKWDTVDDKVGAALSMTSSSQKLHRLPTMSTAPPPGIYVPAVLFFDNNEELDFPSIKSHILRLANGGVTGILIQGSNGEAQHLSHAERSQTIQFARKTLDEAGYDGRSQGKKRVVVMAGTGALSTRETKVLCKEAAEAGAEFVLVLTPGVWPGMMTKEAILKFHRDVADASPVPVLIYNFPVVTAGLDLDSTILSELAQHPNIVGTKLSCGQVAKLHRLTSSQPATSFAAFPGRADILVPSLVCGAPGAIAALPNIAPKAHVRAYELFQEGKLKEAMEIQTLLSHADWGINRIGGVSGVKSFVSKYFGYGNNRPRGPLLAVDMVKTESAEGEWVRKLIEFEKTL
ncbi:unnamed protein product [Rhizoctonia solani]|uniref:Signal recognition particle receptor subunit alpha homolog n=1 Tax=Rhizoctonia solani TaxID=456999 RepID=A0A8H3BMS1_9AGAM|nr:unnamed protein product [Rhizoctonia solani]